MADLQDAVKLEEQLAFVHKLEPPPAPGSVHAPPAAALAAQAQPAAQDGAAEVVVPPARVLAATPALVAGAPLPQAGLLQPAGPAGLSAALQMAAATPGPALVANAPLQEQQQPQQPNGAGPAWQPLQWQGPEQQPPMQQQEWQGPRQHPPMQPLQWQGSGQQPVMQQQEWQGFGQQPHVQQQEWQRLSHSAHAPPVGMQQLPAHTLLHPSPFEATPAAAPVGGFSCAVSRQEERQHAHQHAQQALQSTLLAARALRVRAPAVAASGTQLSVATGALPPRGSAAGSGCQPGSARFYELEVTALPPGTTDGQLASFFRCGLARLGYVLLPYKSWCALGLLVEQCELPADVLTLLDWPKCAQPAHGATCQPGAAHPLLVLGGPAA